MPPIKFKLTSYSEQPVIRLTSFDEHPSWSLLATRVSSIFEIPVKHVLLTYFDRDEITIATNQELQDFYQTLPPMLTNPIRFVVKDASIIRGSQRRRSQGPLFDLEDDWQRVSHLSPHVFTTAMPPRPQSRESGAYVETVDDEEELPEILPEGPRLEVPNEDKESASSVDSILENDGPDKQPIHVFGFDGEPIPKQSARPKPTPTAVSYVSSPPTVPRRPRSRSLSSSSHEGNTRRPNSISRSPTPEEIFIPTHSQDQRQYERPPTRSTVLLDDNGSAINTPEAYRSPLPGQLYVPEERPSPRRARRSRSRSRSPNPDIQHHRLSASPLINFNTPSLAPMIIEVHPGGQAESILINLSPAPPKSPVLFPVEDDGGISPGLTPGEVQESEKGGEKGGAPDPGSAIVSPRSQPRVNIEVADDPPLPTIPSEPGVDPSNASPESRPATVASLTHDVAQLLNSLMEAFTAHPELSAGLRKIVRNASQGIYWTTGHAESIQQEQRENLTQRAAEEAGRRVAEALGGVFRALGDVVGSSSVGINSPVHAPDGGVRVEIRRSEAPSSPQPQAQTFLATEKAPAPPSSAGFSAPRSRSPSTTSTRTVSPNSHTNRRSRSASPERYPRRQFSQNTTPGAGPYHPPGVSIHRPGGIRQFIPLDGPDANASVDIPGMWQRPDMRYGSPIPHPMFASGYYRRPVDPWGPRAEYWGGGKSVPRRSATVPLRDPGSDFIGGFVPPPHMHPYASRPNPAELPSTLGGSGVGMTGTSMTMSSALPSSTIGMSAIGMGEAPPPPPPPPASVIPVQQGQTQSPKESRRDGRPPSYEPAVAPSGTTASLMTLRDELEEAKKAYKEKKDEWRRQREARKLEREIKEKQRAERRAIDYEIRERQNAELQAIGIPVDPNARANAAASPRPRRSGGGGQVLSPTTHLPHISESPLSGGSEIYVGPQPPPVPPKRNEPVKTSSPPRHAPMSSAIVERMKASVMNRLEEMGVEPSAYPSMETLVDQEIVNYQQGEAMLGRVLIQDHAEQVVRKVLDDLFVTPVTTNATPGPSRSGKARER